MGYHKRICEGDSDELRCYSGEIDIISASYGRQRRGVCRYKDHNTNCRAQNALWVVRHRCQGQRSCMLYAENSEFGGDPCVDIGKYVEVGIALIVPVETFQKGGHSLWELTLIPKMFQYLYDMNTCFCPSWCPYLTGRLFCTKVK